VDIKAELRGPTAITTVELSYFNPSRENPMECTYIFPLDKTTVLSRFEAIIDDKVVFTKVTEKEIAQERYDDAIASGNTAVMAERSKKQEETMTVKLGNLLPGKTATLKAIIVSQLEVVGGHFGFILPVAFYPDYRKHGISEVSNFVYEFNYEVKIVAGGRISNLSLPINATVSETDETRTRITITSKKPSRAIDLYYKTRDMFVPQLFYAKSPNSDKVACIASLVPTFDPVSPQDFYEVVEDEKPE
jgi:hypothetical protein